jgi:hypothetical protein
MADTINVGFSPGETLSANFTYIPEFFRSLISGTVTQHPGCARQYANHLKYCGEVFRHDFRF